jgi:hypothetical protein
MLKWPFVLAVVAGLAANAPVVHSQPNPKQGAVEGQHGASTQANSNPTPGRSKQSPLYVKAECEKGCGHAENEGWRERLKSDPNAWFAGAVAVFTFATLLVLMRTNNHFRVSERAYINLSHSPPGVRWTPGHGADHFDVVIRTKNHGATPGRTIGFFMTGKVVGSLDELPKRPIYGVCQSMGSFIVAGDKTFISQPFILGNGDGALVRSGQRLLVVYGFIDYEDQFGTVHRAGYARVYDHRCDIRPAGPTTMVSDEKWAERNNLMFLESRDTYNFDLPVSRPFWKGPRAKPWVEA